MASTKRRPTTSESRNPDLYVALTGKREQFLSFVRARVSSPEAAEDILQAALLKALAARDSVRSPERVEAWFYRVLRNAIVDHYRRSAVAARTFVEEPAAIASIRAPRKANVCRCVGRELSGLKKEYARALEQVDLEGDAVQEFARHEGIAENNASVRLHRARRALRQRVRAACGSCAGSGCFDCTCD